MTYFGKSYRRNKRSDIELLISGAATIKIDQSMTISRRQAMTGSLRGDWKAVGRDIEGAVRDLNREFKTVG